MAVGWQMWRLLSTCVDSSHRISALSEWWYESSSTKKSNKHHWVVNTQKRHLCLTKLKKSKLHPKLILSAVGVVGEEGSKPGNLSAKGRTSNCWNCEWSRARGGWMGILPQSQNFSLRFSLNPFLMTGICYTIESRFSRAHVKFVPVLSASERPHKTQYHFPKHP